jgi:ATP-binding cassette, subfamily B, bacterial CvaB/MchF/RaxB
MSTRFSYWSHDSRVPVILQSEAAECSLACVAMIARFYGARVDLASVRADYSVSLKGANLKTLIEVGSSQGLRGRPLRVDLADLVNLPLPCVLHWNMNHFVVLTRIERRHAIIHDPSVGRRKVPLRDLATSFTGVAIEFLPDSTFTTKESRRQYRFIDLMGGVVGLKRSLLELLAFGLAIQACMLAAPFYLQWVVDEVLVSQDRDLLTVLFLGFGLLLSLQVAISLARSWATAIVTTNLNYQWLSNVFTHLLRLPLPFFEKRQVGDILSRFASIQTIQRGLTAQFVDAVIDGVLVIATLIAMTIYSGTLALISILAIAVFVAVKRVVYQAQKEAAAEQVAHGARQQSHFLESIRGMQSIRLFNRAEERRIGWTNMLADQFGAEMRVLRSQAVSQAASQFIFGVERLLCVFLAAYMAMAGSFSVGMMFAYLSFRESFVGRASALADRIFDFALLRLHAERVADLVLAPAETLGGGQQSIYDVPRIEFVNVGFRYSPSEPYVFRRCSFAIEPGECVAITGPSGGGKTTLVKVFLGLLESTEGEILIAGQRLESFGSVAFRDAVATVMQEDQLFAGSIIDNITFADADPDAGYAIECGKLAGIHDEIVKMPMGYHTLVGEIGTGLSGGQGQRIMLARALYKRPKILILDEATSNLDARNEHHVNESIRRLSLTRIVVAHREETISMADRVIVLDNGDFKEISRKPA